MGRDHPRLVLQPLGHRPDDFGRQPLDDASLLQMVMASASGEASIPSKRRAHSEAP